MMTSERPLDTIIRGAHLIDPSEGLDGVGDIGIRDGLIAEVGSIQSGDAGEIIDGDGLYASPGWIDLHAHVLASGKTGGVHPDREAGVHTGVTTVVDAGTAGWGGWRTLRESVIEPSQTRVLAFMNISLLALRGPRHGDWRNFSQGKTIALVEEEFEAGRCVGIKVLASQTHCGDMGIEPVKLARQAARLSGTGLMVHIGNAPPLVQEVLNLLDDGDIVTHCWHGKFGGLFDRHGKPIPEATAAAERGVKFDIGHGSASFSFETARKALDAGMPVHAISTDIHLRNRNGPVYDMPTTMSKFLHLGFDLGEVIRLSTHSPAQLIGREAEFGSLRVGTSADITLFRIREGEFDFTDSEERTERASRRIEMTDTIRAGNLVSAA